VSATPWDGTTTGPTLNSAQKTIKNSPPLLALVTLGPTNPIETSTLTCTPGTATDADSDAISYSWTWTVNSSPVAATGSTLTGSYFQRGDVVTCTMVP